MDRPPWRSGGAGWKGGERRMRPIFFHYLRLGFLGLFPPLRFRAKDRHNADGAAEQTGAEEKSFEIGSRGTEVL